MFAHPTCMKSISLERDASNHVKMKEIPSQLTKLENVIKKK